MALKKKRARTSRRTRVKKLEKRSNPTLTRIERASAKLGIPRSRLKIGKVKELTRAQRASILGIGVRRVSEGYRLSPALPSEEGAALELFSPMMALATEVNWPGKPKTGMALFSSKYWHISQPSVQVEFDLIEPGKKHLVEMYLTTNQAGPYEFRVIPGPTGQAKDLSLSGNTTVIPEVVNPAPGYNGPYYVSFIHRNTKAAAKSWYFHRMVITVAN